VDDSAVRDSHLRAAEGRNGYWLTHLTKRIAEGTWTTYLYLIIGVGVRYLHFGISIR